MTRGGGRLHLAPSDLAHSCGNADPMAVGRLLRLGGFGHPLALATADEQGAKETFSQ